MPNNGDGTTRMVGWVYFGGIIMILRGLGQAFLGITELVNKKYLFVGDQRLVFAQTNGTAWGWVHLALGVLILAAGWSLLHNTTGWGRLFAIVFMGFSFLVNLAFLGVFPVWSIVALIIDIVIIYALVVQGNDA